MGSNQTTNKPPYSSDPLNRSTCNRVIFSLPLFPDESTRESACFFIETWMMTDKFNRTLQLAKKRVITDKNQGLERGEPVLTKIKASYQLFPQLAYRLSPEPAHRFSLITTS